MSKRSKNRKSKFVKNTNPQFYEKEKFDLQNKAFVASSFFLKTYEWKVLRMKALKMHGARCQCCGASPSTGAVMNVDHIKPRKTHPELALTLDNLQILCGDCNAGKSNWDRTDWRPKAEFSFDPAKEFKERFKSGL